MTPHEWDSLSDIDQLHKALSPPGLEDEERKWMLFGVACCRRIWELIAHPDARKLVEMVEQFADGAFSQKKYDLAVDKLEEQWEDFHTGRADDSVAVAAKAAINLVLWSQPHNVSNVTAEAASLDAPARKRRSVLQQEVAAQAQLIRDIFGNPSRLHALFGAPFRPLTIDPAWLKWNNGAVVRLAEAIYEDRQFQNLPILANALEEAGCSEEALLTHCRGSGPHVRGCWALDLLLGREVDGEWELAEDVTTRPSAARQLRRSARLPRRPPAAP
jgi:hypothetical protein